MKRFYPVTFCISLRVYVLCVFVCVGARACPVLLHLVITPITIYEIGIKWLIGGIETTRD